MKTKTSLSSHVSRFTCRALTFLTLLWTAGIAHAQPTIPVSQLVARGFTNSTQGPYSLNVTGIRGVLFARFDGISLDALGVRAHGGILQLYGLPYAVTLASVNTNTGKLSLSGQINLPTPLKDIPGLPAAQPALLVDGQGNIGFDGGTYTLPTPPYSFPFGPLTIENVTLTINSARDVFGGGADVGFGSGPTIAFCTPQGSTRIHGDFEVVGGQFNQLGVGATNLNKPLGTSGAYLDGLRATIGNLAANGGRNWFLQGNASVKGGGCPVANKWPWRIDAQTTVNSAGYLEVQGTGYTFDVETAMAYFRYNPPYNMAAGGSVNFVKNTVLDGVFIAEIGLQCTAGPQLSGFARGKLTVPRSVPVAGGWVFATAEASFDNSGFRGSATANVTPAIPSVCTPGYCLPGGCIKYPSPTWSNPFRTKKKCWDGPCIPPICSPRIPAVSATVGFRFQSGNFTVSAVGQTPADPMVEPWEKSFQEPIVEPKTGHRFTFMSNWERLDKFSTGSRGRPIASAKGRGGSSPPSSGPPPPPPNPICFDVPTGEESVMFRLTWETPNNALAFMSVKLPEDRPTVSVSSDEAGPGAHILRPLPNWGEGSAYLIINNEGTNREAIIGITHPPAGSYCVQIDHTDSLGNYCVELLRQNVPPMVTVNSASLTEQPTEIQVNYTSIFRFGNTPTNPPTRFFLAQAASDPNPRFGTTHQIKSGGIYLVDSIPSVNGLNTHYLHTQNYNVPDGDYNVVVNIDDPYSLEVEAFSTNKITIHNATAPAPVPSFATRADNGGFTVNWQPSPSSNIQSYIVAYTKSSTAHEFEFHQAADGEARSATIVNLSNSQPYLVTVFAMGTNGIQSCPAETQRVIPTEGYGLNAPMIVSTPRVGATAGQPYVYFPEVFDADDVLRPPVPLPEGEVQPPSSEPQDGQGRQWTLLTAPPGMTIDPSGVIQWTPTEGQVGDHTVTVRVTELSSLPPAQDTNSLVSPRFGEQSYTLTVVGPNNPPAFERNHYRFLTTPPATAFAGEVYRYVPVVLFPTNKFTLTLDDGPVGLTVVVEGTAPNTTNVVVWTVPTNALGHRVVLRAVPDLGPDTTADDIVLQEFYLDVFAPSKRLPQPTVITLAAPTPEGFGLRWVGSATAYQVQRATNLLAPSNTVWESITATGAAAAVNFHVDTNAGPARAFYRILNVP